MPINNSDRLRVLAKAERLAQAITLTCYKIAGELNEKLEPHETATPTARWFTSLAHLAQSEMLEMRLLQVCDLQGLPEPVRRPYRRLIAPPMFSMGPLNARALEMGVAYNVNQVKIAEALGQRVAQPFEQVKEPRV